MAILIDKIIPTFFDQRDISHGGPINRRNIFYTGRKAHIIGYEDDTMKDQMACGFLGFITYALYHHNDDICDALQSGMDAAFQYYEKELDTTVGLADFACLRNLYEFREAPAPVVQDHDLTGIMMASVWCMIVFTSEQQACQQAELLFKTDDQLIATLVGQMYSVYKVHMDFSEFPF